MHVSCQLDRLDIPVNIGYGVDNSIYECIVELTTPWLVCIFCAMIQRNLKPAIGSFFLFGPRGTGKSFWLKNTYAENMVYVDLLAAQTFNRLSADPQRLAEYLPAKPNGPVVVDEIQKVWVIAHSL